MTTWGCQHRGAGWPGFLLRNPAKMPTTGAFQVGLRIGRAGKPTGPARDGRGMCRVRFGAMYHLLMAVDPFIRGLSFSHAKHNSCLGDIRMKDVRERLIAGFKKSVRNNPRG